jgi:rhamnulokinase
MPAAIRDFAKSTGQTVPETKGQIVRCALESLALAYREVAERCSQVTGQRIEVLHIVGGGSRNGLLNQLGANALGVPVLAGPVEATAMGNILVQAMATKDLSSVEELRSVVRASVELVEYQPSDRAEWDAKYAAYRDLQAKVR